MLLHSSEPCAEVIECVNAGQLCSVQATVCISDIDCTTLIPLTAKTLKLITVAYIPLPPPSRGYTGLLVDSL